MDGHLDIGALDGYLAGMLPDGERQQVDDHLAICRACYTIYQERAEIAWQGKKGSDPISYPRKEMGSDPFFPFFAWGVRLGLVLLVLAALWWALGRIG